MAQWLHFSRENNQGAQHTLAFPPQALGRQIRWAVGRVMEASGSAWITPNVKKMLSKTNQVCAGERRLDSNGTSVIMDWAG